MPIARFGGPFYFQNDMNNLFVIAVWLLAAGVLIGDIGGLISMWHDYKRRGWVGQKRGRTDQFGLPVIDRFPPMPKVKEPRNE